MNTMGVVSNAAEHGHAAVVDVDQDVVALLLRTISDEDLAIPRCASENLVGQNCARMRAAVRSEVLSADDRHHLTQALFAQSGVTRVKSVLGLVPFNEASVGGEPASLVVMKFGGSSLAGLGHLQRVAEIVRTQLPKRPVVVLSAMGKTTDQLLAAANKALETGNVDISKLKEFHEGVIQELGIPMPAAITELLSDLSRVLSGVALLKEISSRTRDMIVSFGERLSIQCFTAVFNSALEDGAAPAKALNSWEIGMITTSGGGSADSAFSESEILPTSYTSIAASLGPLKTNYTYVPVVTGYIAHDGKGVITTLGRDGSDLTATVIGAAAEASEVQIWKDVDGVMTTDPRVVPAARPVKFLTFEEAAELTNFGAKVVHPAAVMPAWLAKIPMSVRNSTAPERPHTRIVAELDAESARGEPVAALSSRRNIVVVQIRSRRVLGQHGFLAHVFQALNKLKVPVDIVSTSEGSVSLNLDQDYKSVDLQGLRDQLQMVASVDLLDRMATLTLIAHKADSVSVLRQCFQVFEEMEIKVEMVSYGASNVNITFVIPDESLLPATKRIHTRFFEQ